MIPLLITLLCAAPLAAAVAGDGDEPLPSPDEIAKLPPDGGDEFNRLVFEQSPYLRQHARNPVDWYPWGEAAFARAKAEDKPIFFSSGYSTCHWCHVMERESFEDAEVAALLNEHFVCVKLDREERPDVDQVYMSVTQMLTRGAGGWPNTVVMTPDKDPFWAATYLPKRGQLGRPGMMEVLPWITQAWAEDRDSLLGDADQITKAIAAWARSKGGEALSESALARAEAQLAATFDERYGGFGDAPKFPVAHRLRFLLRRAARTDDDETVALVEATLSGMLHGGIRDHVGFGFHRYSTDARWFLPHFEKMLYDQALITSALVEAWLVTGRADFERAARETLTYVLRDMRSPQGAFFSAEDADSEGEEGLFYVWTPEQVTTVLGAEEGELWNGVYGVVPGGNFLEEATQRATGRSVLYLPRPLAEVAQELELEESELRARLEASRQKLFAAREQRVHPLLDDKVLTDWNGLMIGALALAGRSFGDPQYVEAARRAADFVLRELRTEDGELLKRWRAGEAALPAVLDDYAFLVEGLIELYEATFEARWLAEALALTDAMIARFADDEHGGFFLGADDGEVLFVRPKEIADGALPSGQAVAATNLVRLARLTGRSAYEERAIATLNANAGSIGHPEYAYYHAASLIALDFALGPSFEVVIAGDPGADDTRAMLAALRERFLPHKVVLLRPPGDEPEIVRLAEFTRDQRAQDGRATAYVCREHACKAPTTSIETMLAHLAQRDEGEGDR